MKERIVRVWRWGKDVVCSFLDTHCSIHAAGLTYYSMLAIVPILCVLLLLAKTLGADQLAKRHLHAEFEEQVARFEEAAGLNEPDEVAELPAEGQSAESGSGEQPVVAVNKQKMATRAFVDQARTLESCLLERIDQFNAGTLGWIGLLMLLWTIVGSIGMVEVSFNEIWGVLRPRVLWRQILLYLFVAFVLPILSALAMSFPLLKVLKDVISGSFGAMKTTSWLSAGMIWVLDSWAIRLAISLSFSTLTFAFLFAVIPNCRVRFRPAFWSGLATALLFSGWMKVCAVAQVGIAKSSALYGSFAFLPIVLAWIYVSWQIILLGCCMAKASSQS